MVIDHLQAHPDESFTAVRISRIIDKPSGAIANALSRLISLGVAEQVSEMDDATGVHLRGAAHDFSVRLLGGICGIAGAFSVLADLAAFLRHMLVPAAASEQPGFGANWVERSLQIHTGELTPERGLFWHPAPSTVPATDDVWVHYGFTGTGMWISPSKGRWAILLTNKLYYTRDRDPLTAIRNAFCTAAFS
ncbi:serine hydrolase [Streptomyces angustmyceticus]|uniref:Beta-lactamase-related domain-containing protein n=1 Tax=Streptomyces angustmyceticus TaxID=285578 RepID=A0A5J4L484_9ACTN|nr:serine hydrolase [Streptomyces angustmyceticus]GES28833.1 hypothetical protein San01_13200 [Streptomyces angustmyceticus]